ncbi:MAG: metallophosphoesterase [Limisphaerales bacterium]
MTKRLSTPRLRRRTWLRLLFYGSPLLALAHAGAVEPRWLTVKRLRLPGAGPATRLVHFTDLHHKGDTALLGRVVKTINDLAPEAVCFTGDLVEDARHLPEALEGLRGIQAPLFGVPGNHDYWAGLDFDAVDRAFRATGGRWLLDEAVGISGGKVHLLGASCREAWSLEPKAGSRNVVLIHYPSWVQNLPPATADLILAGHSHGGQVRLPFIGPLVLPAGVDGYDLGRFTTPAGVLYVGAGIGWFYLNLRFRCRPEVTLIEMGSGRS